MATGTIAKINEANNAWATYSSISISSGSWKTNTGQTSGGIRPDGSSASGGYNLLLNIAGKYIVTFSATAENSSTSGQLGVRLYVSETNTAERFTSFAPQKTGITQSFIVESDGTNTVRFGLYQSSGSTITFSDLSLTAIPLL